MRVIIYAPPEVQALDLAAVCDVLAAANHAAPSPPFYDVHVVADTDAPFRSLSGLTIVPDAAIGDGADAVAADLLIVAASRSWRAAPAPGAGAWLRRQAGGAVRYGSIGNGAFPLGAAGLLDGRRVTTHWDCSEPLAEAFPAILVEPDRIYARDGPVFSSAGGIASMDLLLALVEEDHGRELALQLARDFVMFMKRSGGQAQLSVQLATQGTTRDPIQRAQKHVRDYPAGDLSVAALAAVAAMSPRNFARVFLQETGVRPADFVELSRVNLARRMLEESALAPQQVARMCGFSGTEAARRAFKRRTGVTMSRYRAGLWR